jgi:hypothetical protein
MTSSHCFSGHPPSGSHIYVLICIDTFHTSSCTFERNVYYSSPFTYYFLCILFSHSPFHLLLLHLKTLIPQGNMLMSAHSLHILPPSCICMFHFLGTSYLSCETCFLNCITTLFYYFFFPGFYNIKKKQKSNI